MSCHEHMNLQWKGQDYLGVFLAFPAYRHIPERKQPNQPHTDSDPGSLFLSLCQMLHRQQPESSRQGCTDNKNSNATLSDTPLCDLSFLMQFSFMFILLSMDTQKHVSKTSILYSKNFKSSVKPGIFYNYKRCQPADVLLNFFTPFLSHTVCLQDQ